MTSIDNIHVSYPQGAGGVWLAAVIRYCAVPSAEWSQRAVNFHKHHRNPIDSFHHADITDNVISIGNGSYKFNFWKLYAYKRILYELTYKRVKGSRVVVCPYNHYNDPRDDYFWLVNQVRFIQEYRCPGRFQIDWKDLFYNPEQAWNTICKFLEHNQIENYRKIDQFLITLENYKNTCNQINFSVNFKHKLFKIWALAFLQNNNYLASFDVFKNFESSTTDQWILSNKNLILDYTNTNFINIQRT
jgi:hypothetical protein